MFVPLEYPLVFEPEENLLATKPLVEKRVKVVINLKYLKETVMIGSTLIEKGRNKLCGLLQRNLDVFTWKPADMTGVPIHIVKHCLNVREGCSPVRQRKKDKQPIEIGQYRKKLGNLWRYQSGEWYHAVPPPYTGTFMPFKPDLVFHDAPTVNETVPTAFNIEPSTTKPTHDLS
nr:reverse transcriptase domain-containing protein [Tanacetum cinerariifolium]